MAVEATHVPVMPEQMERLLFRADGPQPEGSYCDCTAGAGGYARRILDRVPKRRLVVVDRDKSALDDCRSRLAKYSERTRYFHGGFSRIGEAVQDCLPLAGVVADLGLSRTQLDDGKRGFSLRLEGPLDMRFDRTQDRCAEDIVNRGGESELANLLYQLADERRSRRIARAIVRARPIRSTLHLADTVAWSVPRRRGQRIHPATRTFQALRIAVNDELGELRVLLSETPELLSPGGRFVVVSFHSGEDRMVKVAFRRLAAAGRHHLLTRRVVRPSAEEVESNPPSRSARMRALCRSSVEQSTQ